MSAQEYYLQQGFDLKTLPWELRVSIGSQYLANNPVTIEEIEYLLERFISKHGKEGIDDKRT